MTGSNGMSPGFRVAVTVTRLDRLINSAQSWLEDLLPWYDRDVEEAKAARTDEIRRRSIARRQNWERIERLYQERLAGRRS